MIVSEEIDTHRENSGGAARVSFANLPAVAGFRFLLVYFSLFYSSFFLPIVPYSWPPWVAVHVFGLSGPVTQYHATGSGDTTLSYVRAFVLVGITLLLTLVWLAVDRRRRFEGVLYPWARLVVRFSLANTMLSYGFVKVFPMQFPDPGIVRLTETFGESSPMGILWAMMGASPGYQIFSGALEAMAGLLLLFRRTSTLGAISACAVLLNVVALNVFYDVGVKLYSCHYLLMGAFLLAPDAKALWKFLVLRQPSKLEGVHLPRFERRWLRYASVAMQVVTVGALLNSTLLRAFSEYRARPTELSKRDGLYGIWEADGAPTTLSSSSPYQDWQRILIEREGSIGIRRSDGSLFRLGMTPDIKKQTMRLRGWNGPATGSLSYRRVDDRHLSLTGTVEGQPFRRDFHRLDLPAFALRQHRVHWITDYSYNY